MASPQFRRAVVGQSQALKDVYEIVDRIADTPCTVLVTGESGSGKEVIAGSLHLQSGRTGELIAVNCGAIPETLLESEMFGHTKGAFTGASSAKEGYVALAEGGTLFLDEIGELPAPLQVTLLRLLQQQEYTPIGAGRPRKANVRIVAATNIDLEQAVAERKFREDLFYRLNVIHIRVPSLRERREDIPLLAKHFLTRSRIRSGRNVRSITSSAVEALLEYDWPGNVRELENTLERAVLLARGEEITVDDLSPHVLARSKSQEPRSFDLPQHGLDLREAVARYEDALIAQALRRTSWNKNKAAQLLGLNRTTLVEMIKRKQLEPKSA